MTPGQRGPCSRLPTLKTYSERTGQDSHSRMVDWSIFRKASPPAQGDPTRLYRPEDYDFSLTANSAAIDAGVFCPASRMATPAGRRTSAHWNRGRPVPSYGPRPLTDQP